MGKRSLDINKANPGKRRLEVVYQKRDGGGGWHSVSRQKLVRLNWAIAEHRARLVPIRAEAERGARACGLTGGPAALYVARELRKVPLGASTYTKGDRRKRAKLIASACRAVAAGHKAERRAVRIVGGLPKVKADRRAWERARLHRERRWMDLARAAGKVV